MNNVMSKVLVASWALAAIVFVGPRIVNAFHEADGAEMDAAYEFKYKHPAWSVNNDIARAKVELAETIRCMKGTGHESQQDKLNKSPHCRQVGINAGLDMYDDFVIERNRALGFTVIKARLRAMRDALVH
jgi:hypothetical protein